MNMLGFKLFSVKARKNISILVLPHCEMVSKTSQISMNVVQCYNK